MLLTLTFFPISNKSQNLKIVSVKLPFPLEVKPVKVILKSNWRIFIFCTLGTNG